jgi:hypothetical protein
MDGDDLAGTCAGCDTTEEVAWSPLFGWLCTRCQWQRTEDYFMRQRVTILRDRRPGEGGRPAA